MKTAQPFVAPGASAPPRIAPTFCVSRSQASPTYHQLSLEDDKGCVASWVIPLPLKQLSKKHVLLWLLPAAIAPEAHACVESGPVRQVPSRDGTPADLRRTLAQGLLQLNFSGHWLSGYHRLRRLPEGNGQLWQLSPIG
jgi:hypothetical protein